jgi:hypothetical protein
MQKILKENLRRYKKLNKYINFRHEMLKKHKQKVSKFNIVKTNFFTTKKKNVKNLSKKLNVKFITCLKYNVNLFWFLRNINIYLLFFSKSILNFWLDNFLFIKLNYNFSFFDFTNFSFFFWVFTFQFKYEKNFNIWRRLNRPFVYKIYVLRINFGLLKTKDIINIKSVGEALMSKLNKKFIH